MFKSKRWYCGLSQLESGEVGYTFYLDFHPANEFSIQLDPRPWVTAATMEEHDKIFISASLRAYFEIDVYFIEHRLKAVGIGFGMVN